MEGRSKDRIGSFKLKMYQSQLEWSSWDCDTKYLLLHIPVLPPSQHLQITSLIELTSTKSWLISLYFYNDATSLKSKGGLNSLNNQKIRIGSTSKQFKSKDWEFLGNPVVKTWSFHCCCWVSVLNWGAKILPAAWQGHKIKNNFLKEVKILAFNILKL